jgi:hypothetical protein
VFLFLKFSLSLLFLIIVHIIILILTFYFPLSEKPHEAHAEPEDAGDVIVTCPECSDRFFQGPHLQEHLQGCHGRRAAVIQGGDRIRDRPETWNKAREPKAQEKRGHALEREADRRVTHSGGLEDHGDHEDHGVHPSAAPRPATASAMADGRTKPCFVALTRLRIERGTPSKPKQTADQVSILWITIFCDF